MLVKLMTINDHILKDRLQLLVFQEDRRFFLIRPPVYLPKFPRNADYIKYEDDQRSHSCKKTYFITASCISFDFI